MLMPPRCTVLVLLVLLLLLLLLLLLSSCSCEGSAGCGQQGGCALRGQGTGRPPHQRHTPGAGEPTGRQGAAVLALT